MRLALGCRLQRPALLWIAVPVLAGCALAAILHLPVTRHAVLSLVQSRLKASHGILLESSGLDYSLLVPSLELQRIALKPAHLPGAAPFASADRLRIRFRFRDLLRASAVAHDVRIEALTLRWVVDREGRSNLPRSTSQASDSRMSWSRIRTLEAPGIQLWIINDQANLYIHLPRVDISAGDNDAAWSLRCEARQQGSIRWRGKELPIDAFQLSSLFRGKDCEIQSGLVRSADSQIRLTGGIRNLQRPVLSLSAEADFDAQPFWHWANAEPRLDGRIQLALALRGTLDAFKLDADLRSGALKAGSLQLYEVTANSRYDSESTVLSLTNISAGVCSGVLRAGGRIAAKEREGPSRLSMELRGAELQSIASLLGKRLSRPGTVTARMNATWPGLAWRQASIDGSVQSKARGERTGALAAMSFRSRLRGDVVDLTVDSLAAPGIAVRGDLHIASRDGALRGNLRGNIADLALALEQTESWLGRSTGSLQTLPLQGTASFTLEMAGNLKRPLASIDMHSLSLSAGRLKDATLDLRVNYEPERLQLEQMDLRWRNQRATASGEVDLASPEAPLKFEARIERASAAEVSAGLRGPGDISGTLSAKINVGGTVVAPVAHLALEAEDLQAYGEPLGRLSAIAEWRPQVLELQRFVLEKPQQHDVGRLDARGFADLANRQYEFKLSGENLRAASLVLPGDIPVCGALRLRAEGRGSLDNPSLRVEAQAEDLRAADLDLGALQGDLRLGDRRLDVKLRDPTHGILAQADILTSEDYPINVEIAASQTPLSLLPDAIRSLAKGSFDGTIKGSGRLLQPDSYEGYADLASVRFTVGHQEVHNEGPVRLRYAGKRLELPPFELAAGSSKIRLSGNLPLSASSSPGSIMVDGSVSLDSIARLFAIDDQVQMRGSATLRAEVAGSWEDPQASARVTLRDGRGQIRILLEPLEDLAADLQLRDNVITVDNASARLVGGSIRGSGALPLRFFRRRGPPPPQGSGPARFSLQADKIALASLVKLREGTGGRFKVRIDGEAAELTSESLQAHIEFEEAALEADKFQFQQAAPTSFDVERGQLRVKQFRWEGPQTRLELAGTVSFAAGREIDLSASGTTDARLLEFFSPWLRISGPARVDVKIRGDWQAPSFSGYFEVNKGNLALHTPRLLAEDLDLRLSFEGKKLVIDKLSGALNGGLLQGNGSAAWRAGRLEDVNVDVLARDVFLDFPPGLKTSSQAALRFRSRDGNLVIGGDLEMREGSYHDPVDIAAFSDLSKQPSFGAGGAEDLKFLGNKVVFDITARTRQPVEIDNNLARLAASANVRLVGSPQRPGMLGNLLLEQGGKLHFGNREYVTERGAVTFANESRIDPVFDVLAATRVSDYRIALQLTGTIKDFSATFTSDPALSQEDIISILLTGKTQSETGGSGVDISQAERVAMFSSALSAQLSGRLRRDLGISQVSIDPGLIGAESDPGSRLTIAQDLSHSMRLIYSMNLENSSDQIWVANYEVSNRFGARAVKQKDNTYRADFSHEFRFGGRLDPSAQASHLGTAGRRVGSVQFAGSSLLTEAELARKFKVKPGERYDFAKIRKGVDRVGSYYRERGYLEARVRVQAEEHERQVDLRVEVYEGKRVRILYRGMDLPRSVEKRVRTLWLEGISDTHRTFDAVELIRSQLAIRGYPQAEVTCTIEASENEEKQARFEIHPGARFKEMVVAFDGADPFHAGELASLFRRQNLNRVVFENPRHVLEAVGRYYQRQGFLLAKAEPPRYDLNQESRTGRVVLQIQEGPQFRVGALRFAGNRSLSETALKVGLPLRQGAIFDPALASATATALDQKYGRLGFRNPEIQYEIQRDDAKALVDLDFKIEENRRSLIESVQVQGQEHTSEKFVREQLEFASGQAADEQKVSRSIRNLYRTGAFSRVDIGAESAAGAQPGLENVERVNMVVKVQEPKPFTFIYGGFYDSGRGPGVIADLKNQNSLGAGRTLGLRTRYDRELVEGRVYFSQPLLKKLPLTTTVAAFASREERYLDVYDLDSTGFTLQQELALPKKLRLYYGYKYTRKIQTSREDPAASPVKSSVSALSTTLSRNTRDDYLDATSGSFTSHAVEWAPAFLWGSSPGIRYFGQYFKYLPISKPQYYPFGDEGKRPRFIFATGIRLGLLKTLNEELVPSTERFYAGGGTTVRGFAQDQLGPKDAQGNPIGGNALFISNNEIRFPVKSIFDGVAFLDVGNVFPKLSDFSFSGLRASSGFGLRLRTPFVMLRFDYGFKLDRRPGESRGAFFFSIGQAF